MTHKENFSILLPEKASSHQLKKENHQGIECFFDQEKDIHFISNMHSNTLGINNGYHAIRSGGIRRHEKDEEELDVIIDGLNLSWAMSLKIPGLKSLLGQ